MTVGEHDYKEGLSRFATGITVVTAVDDEPRGMTATSFASVSLEPPLISVSLEKGSQTRAAALGTGVFAVNVLAANQEALSRLFATKGNKPFDNVPIGTGANGCPLIDGAIACLQCSVDKVIEAGDHDIIVGLVTEIETREGEPLLYFRRGYRELGPPAR